MPPFAARQAQLGVPRAAKTMPVVRAMRTNENEPFRYPYRITGTTKDSTGAALPGCTVELFRTADDSKVDETVSDGAGLYAIPASEQLQHYAVAYKPGAPDVAGTTVNTLMGT